MHEITVSKYNTVNTKELLHNVVDLHKRGVLSDDEFESLIKVIGSEFVVSEISDIFTETIERNIHKWLSSDIVSYAR